MNGFEIKSTNKFLYPVFAETVSSVEKNKDDAELYNFYTIDGKRNSIRMTDEEYEEFKTWLAETQSEFLELFKYDEEDV